jgi:hypothetical protein
MLHLYGRQCQYNVLHLYGRQCQYNVLHLYRQAVSVQRPTLVSAGSVSTTCYTCTAGSVSTTCYTCTAGSVSTTCYTCTAGSVSTTCYTCTAGSVSTTCYTCIGRQCQYNVLHLYRQAVSVQRATLVSAGSVSKTCYTCIGRQCQYNVLHLYRPMIIYWRAVRKGYLHGEAPVQFHVSSLGICGRRCRTGTHYLPSTSVFPCHCISTNAPYSFIHHQPCIIIVTDSVVK